MSATKINRIHKELHRIRANFQAESLQLITELMTLCQITTADLETYIQRSGTKLKSTTTRASSTSTGQRSALAAKKKGTGTKTPKPGNYRRGPQPAKYRHPKSGETWSGFGRPPSWIADEKDRTKFLIKQ